MSGTAIYAADSAARSAPQSIHNDGRMREYGLDKQPVTRT
jgi:hypothetical protein